MTEELTSVQKQAVSMGSVVDIDQLHQVSEPIGEIEDTELLKLIDRMERTLIATRGVGLAHVQIAKDNSLVDEICVREEAENWIKINFK